MVFVWPAWEVREGEHATRWFHVRLAFADGAGVEALALVSGLCVCVEDVRARPALSLEDLALFADWIEGPLARVRGAGVGTASAPVIQSAAEVGAVFEDGSEVRAGPPGTGEPNARGRAVRPRELVGRGLVAREYREAQKEGTDPVLAVMCATGYSRRGALRVIGRARDAGLLAARHVRRSPEQEEGSPPV